MIRTTFGLLALLALLPALPARDKAETPTPTQQYQALVKEYQTAMMEFRKAYFAAKTPQDQQKVFQEKYPRPDKFAPRFLEVAEKNPQDPAAVDALIWIVQSQVDTSDPKGPRAKALKILFRDHVQNEKMVKVCYRLGFARDEESRQLMRAVLEKNKYRSAQAHACLSLARQTENRLRLARRFKDQPEMAKRYEVIRGKEAFEALAKADLDKLSKEVEAFYERIVKDFADVAAPDSGTFGEMAEQKLEGLRHPILVGKPVPEIDGEDIDSKKFKLSDYRGKVVMLDFWGHW